MSHLCFSMGPWAHTSSSTVYWLIITFPLLDDTLAAHLLIIGLHFPAIQRRASYRARTTLDADWLILSRHSTVR